MALNRECNDRDYLYGRLLAVADYAESLTQFKKGTEVDGQRETNARRFMSAFSQRPMKTWKVIEERLEPYWFKLSTGTRIFLQNEMNEIFDKFDVDSFSNDSTLNGLYLLGYHSQIIAFKSKKKEEAQDE